MTAAVDSLIYDPHDPANLNNYISRLSSYYDDAERTLTLILLDAMAALSSPKHVSDLANLSRHQDPSLSDDHVRETLNSSREDHYVTPHQTQMDLPTIFVGSWLSAGGKRPDYETRISSQFQVQSRQHGP